MNGHGAKPGLVPVLMTDRTGRTQIRHVRPERAASGRPIPAPRSPAAATNDLDWFIGILRDAAATGVRIPGADGEWLPSVRAGLEAAQQEDPGLIPVAERLMTTGSTTARGAAAALLRGTLERIGRSIRLAAKQKQPPGPFAEDYLGADFHNELASLWAAGGVLDERGRPAHLNDHGMIRLTSDMRWAARKLRKVIDAPEDRSGPEWDWYWRGLAALSSTGTPMLEASDNGADAAALVLEFVRLAGTAPSIPAVLDAVRERGAKTPEAGVEVLRTLGAHHGSLADGAL